jgi:hypothetical protein
VKTTTIAAGSTNGVIAADVEPFGTITMSRDSEGDEVVADIGQRNPHVKAFAKRAGVTAEEIRKHGSKAIAVLPNLRELWDATVAREKRGR